MHAFVSNGQFRQDVAISVISGAWDRLTPKVAELTGERVPLSSDGPTQYRRQVMRLIFLRGVGHAVQHAEGKGFKLEELKSEYPNYRPLFGTVECHRNRPVIVHVFFDVLKRNSTDLHYASIHVPPGHDTQQLHTLCHAMSKGVEIKGTSAVAEIIEKTPLQAFWLAQGRIPPELQDSLSKHLNENTDLRSSLPIRAATPGWLSTERHNERQAQQVHQVHGRLIAPHTAVTAQLRSVGTQARQGRSRPKQGTSTAAKPTGAHYRTLATAYEKYVALKEEHARSDSSQPFSDEAARQTMHNLMLTSHEGDKEHFDFWISRYIQSKQVTLQFLMRRSC